MGEIDTVNELGKWAAEMGGFEGHRFFRTSGSSGEEKWIALSERALEWSARSVIEALEISASDVLGLALPEIHVGGYGLVVRARISRARLARFEGKWDAAKFTEWCRKEEVTVSSLVPTQVHDLVAGGCQAADSLRVIVVGGGALEDGLKERARELGWPVEPSYGMTETSSQVATGDGLPLLPGWEARVENERLALKGGGLLTAVIRKRDGVFFAEDPKVDGWFLTNDRVELRGRGLRFLGRADRLVKVLGELVDLDEVEAFWKEALSAEVAVVVTPDERRGAALHLFYEGPEQELEKRNQGVPGLARLASWINLEQLPKSPLGKIDRAALKKFHQKNDCNGMRGGGG